VLTIITGLGAFGLFYVEIVIRPRGYLRGDPMMSRALAKYMEHQDVLDILFSLV
jgi:hypothetical protein